MNHSKFENNYISFDTDLSRALVKTLLTSCFSTSLSCYLLVLEIKAMLSQLLL